jgi:hypothetical protein
MDPAIVGATRLPGYPLLPLPVLLTLLGRRPLHWNIFRSTGSVSVRWMQ